MGGKAPAGGGGGGVNRGSFTPQQYGNLANSGGGMISSGLGSFGGRGNYQGQAGNFAGLPQLANLQGQGGYDAQQLQALLAQYGGGGLPSLPTGGMGGMNLANLQSQFSPAQLQAMLGGGMGGMPSFGGYGMPAGMGGMNMGQLQSLLRGGGFGGLGGMGGGGPADIPFTYEPVVPPEWGESYRGVERPFYEGPADITPDTPYTLTTMGDLYGKEGWNQPIETEETEAGDPQPEQLPEDLPDDAEPTPDPDPTDPTTKPKPQWAPGDMLHRMGDRVYDRFNPYVESLRSNDWGNWGRPRPELY